MLLLLLLLLLTSCVQLQSRRHALAEELTLSCGKPITQSLGEVDRAILTFSLAADECRRGGGEFIPLDVDARAEVRAIYFAEP